MHDCFDTRSDFLDAMSILFCVLQALPEERATFELHRVRSLLFSGGLSALIRFASANLTQQILLALDNAIAMKLSTAEPLRSMLEVVMKFSISIDDVAACFRFFSGRSQVLKPESSTFVLSEPRDLSLLIQLDTMNADDNEKLSPTIDGSIELGSSSDPHPDEVSEARLLIFSKIVAACNGHVSCFQLGGPSLEALTSDGILPSSASMGLSIQRYISEHESSNSAQVRT